MRPTAFSQTVSVSTHGTARQDGSRKKSEGSGRHLLNNSPGSSSALQGHSQLKKPRPPLRLFFLKKPNLLLNENWKVEIGGGGGGGDSVSHSHSNITALNTAMYILQHKIKLTRLLLNTNDSGDGTGTCLAHSIKCRDFFL